MTLDAGQTQIRLGWRGGIGSMRTSNHRRIVARYAFAEQEAKARRVGLWQDPDPVPPWEWRRR